jgi:hypothetical protein
VEEKALHEDHDYGLDEESGVKVCAEPVEDSIVLMSEHGF